MGIKTRVQVRNLGLPLIAILVLIGTFWAYTRGGHDFEVFYHAWGLVLSGRGLEIYSDSPDRFLYAPGFAWIFTPLGLLPKSVALAIWTLSKAIVLLAVLQVCSIGRVCFGGKNLSPSEKSFNFARVSLAACAILVLARPLLIDFQYGQVNLLIMGSCFWALLVHAGGSNSGVDKVNGSEPAKWKVLLAWFLLGLAAVSKVFAIPLLILPWLRTANHSKSTLRLERIGAILGAAAALFLPAITVGVHNASHLLVLWREALLVKGLPFESHNQSFAAFLHHYFTVEPTHVIALGHIWIVMGRDLLNVETITILSLAWTFLWTGILLLWLLKADLKNSLRWVAGALALLFVPSHLVWKPYLVFGIPLVIILMIEHRRARWALMIAFVLINLTGFDLIGGFWAGRFEAASIFLWAHLLMLGGLMFSPTQPLPNPKTPSSPAR